METTVWLVIGLIFGAGVFWLANWMASKNMAFTWYEWVIGIIGLLLLLFTIQNFFGSQAELEPKAASMFLLVTGLPAVVLLVITGVLASRHKVTA